MMKPTRAAWANYGVVSAVCLGLLVGGYWVHNPVYQVLTSACIFVPLFVGTALSGSGKRKP